MRYPIYFFLLLSGFFYLTGKPITDSEVGKKGGEEQAVNGMKSGRHSLPYARRTADSSLAEKSGSVAAKKQEKAVAKPLQKTARMVGVKAPVKDRKMAALHKVKEGDAAVASKTTSHNKKAAGDIGGVPVEWPSKKKTLGKGDLRQAALSAGRNGLNWWKTEVKPSKQASVSSSAVKSSLESSKKLVASRGSFGRRSPEKRLGRPSHKRLDWTVFGGARTATRTASPSRHRLTRDELDANGLAEDEVVSYTRPQRLARKALGRSARARAKSRRKFRKRASRKLAKVRRVRKKRKIRVAPRRRARRVARFNRRNRNVYRIARRRSIRKVRKRRYASYRRRRHKSFGFGTFNGVTSLFGDF